MYLYFSNMSKAEASQRIVYAGKCSYLDTVPKAARAVKLLLSIISINTKGK